MFRSHLALLCCPECRGELVCPGNESIITNSLLECARCGAVYPVRGGVPRFVANEDYCAPFGFQWSQHMHTQHDSATGLPLSHDRFFHETGWPQNMTGEVILEAGSGAGRFTEVAAQTGAMVVSFDYSQAVDVNHAINGHLPNVLIVQANAYAMPFRGQFDRAFAFGLIQHTPDPERTLQAVASMVRPGGHLCIDCYERTAWTPFIDTMYWTRPLTRRMQPAQLYRLASWWTDFLWPLARRLRRLGRLGRSINWRLGIADWSDLPLSDEQLRDWARLDLFDVLSPRYVLPQSAATIRRWAEAADLSEIDIERPTSLVVLRARSNGGRRSTSAESTTEPMGRMLA